MRIKDLIIYKPVDTTQNVITSRFYALRWWRGRPMLHGAYDWAPFGSGKYKGQDIIAGVHSRVIQIFNELGGFGLYVKLQAIDNPKLIGYHAHLADTYVKEGDIVLPKQKIGLMGNSGHCVSRSGSDGTHEHNEWRYSVGRGEYAKVDTAWNYKDFSWAEAFRA